MIPRINDRRRAAARRDWSRLGRRCRLFALALLTLLGVALGLAAIRVDPFSESQNNEGCTPNPWLADGGRSLSLADLLKLTDGAFNSLDIIELNLAIAREIPECNELDVRRYQKAVDEWAAWIKQETERHWYRFKQNPSEYRNSEPYFRALVMCTVIGQDFKVRYDLEDFSFEQPEDLFVHGVIDKRKGTCVSLPVLYIAIGQRLGYPTCPHFMDHLP